MEPAGKKRKLKMSAEIKYPSVRVNEYTSLIGKAKIGIMRWNGAFVEAITPVQIYNNYKLIPWKDVKVWDMENEEGYYVLVCKPGEPTRFELHRYGNPDFMCLQDVLRQQVNDFKKRTGWTWE